MTAATSALASGRVLGIGRGKRADPRSGPQPRGDWS